MRCVRFLPAMILATVLVQQVHAENIYGLKPGHPPIQSISSLTFGPDGILFVGDSKGAAIYALETGDTKGDKPVAEEVSAIIQQVAKIIGVTAPTVKITDLAVNPETKSIFLAAETVDKPPRLFSLRGGEAGLTELDLSDIPFSVAALPNAAEDKDVMIGNRTRNNRSNAVTAMSFANGQLLVAGLSNDQSASNVWSLMFPFQEVDRGTPLEIYHAAHGRSEDYAPIRTFVPFIVNGEPNLLAGFVCTPLVRFPLKQLAAKADSKEKVQGTTVAELGNRNQPLDMIAYKKDGKDFLLLSNSARGVMKISTEDLGRKEGITTPVPDGKTSGQPYDEVGSLKGTVQMDKYDDTHAVVIIQSGVDPAVLKIVELP